MSELSQEEIRRLLQWKKEATEVIRGLQDLGRALGLQIGLLVTGPLAIEAAKTLRAERDAALAEADALRESIRELRADLAGHNPKPE